MSGCDGNLNEPATQTAESPNHTHTGTHTHTRRKKRTDLRALAGRSILVLLVLLIIFVVLPHNERVKGHAAEAGGGVLVLALLGQRQVRHREGLARLGVLDPERQPALFA